MSALQAYLEELRAYVELRWRCYRSGHDLAVYVSPFTELPGLLSCKCKKIHRAIDIVPLSDLSS